MKLAMASVLAGVAALLAGCGGSNSMQNLNAAPFNRTHKPDATKSKRWNFLCVENPMQGDAKYEATFKDLYGISLEGYCKVAS